MKWFKCTGCDTEFRVVSDTDAPVDYCAFCGDIVSSDDDEESDDLDDE